MREKYGAFGKEVMVMNMAGEAHIFPIEKLRPASADFCQYNISKRDMTFWHPIIVDGMLMFA